MTCESTLPTTDTNLGNVGEGGAVLGRLAVLEHPIELDEVFCPACNCVSKFVIEFQWANGLFGSCVRCGDERVAWFTRTVSEGE
jgi:hypothetical protein